MRIFATNFPTVAAGHKALPIRQGKRSTANAAHCSSAQYIRASTSYDVYDN